ncbi:MAG: flagellar export chaperone FlgN [Planctomycetes bacterium]|nr:flagellar export chaperone FlgN [Planctomycetota bacterium]
MNTATARNRVPDLLTLCRGLESLYDELLITIRGKLDAMKRSDVGQMRTFNERERNLAQRIREREGLRRQLMDVIGAQLGLPAATGRALSASQLAARLEPGQSAELREIAGRLREKVTCVSSANRVAGVIARRITDHLQWVFAAVKPTGDKPAAYSGEGTITNLVQTTLFSAVG